MNIRHNDALREKLASEYVLGTLKGGARRRFESWLQDDAALRRAVAEWQDRLCPLAEMTPAISPSAQVWRAIEKRLDQSGAQAAQLQPGKRTGWKDSLDFWRRLGVASTALAAMLMVVLLARDPAVNLAAPTSIAVLTDDQARTAMVITGDARRGQLTVKVVAPQTVGSDRSLELWALPKDGAPRSLGLVAANAVVTLTLPKNMSPQSIPALAISLEPKGGSPNPNGPTGPVLMKGAWVQI